MGGKQLSFADALSDPRLGANRRLEAIGAAIDWAPLAALSARLRPGRTGRPPYEPLVMLKALLLQRLYALSDPQLEEALFDRLSFRRFCGFAAGEGAPDETTLCRFRQDAAESGVLEACLDEVNRQLAAKGLMLKTGTLIDATIIAAKSRKPEPAAGLGAQVPSEPDADWTKKNGRAHFGYRLHAGVDEGSGLIRRLVLTPARVNESLVADDLICGDERAVYGDKGYESKERRARLKARGIKDRIMHRSHKNQAALPRWQARRNALIARRRAAVERVFGTLKRLHGLARARCSTLARNLGDMIAFAIVHNLRRAAAPRRGSLNASAKLSCFPPIAQAPATNRNRITLHGDPLPPFAEVSSGRGWPPHPVAPLARLDLSLRERLKRCMILTRRTVAAGLAASLVPLGRAAAQPVPPEEDGFRVLAAAPLKMKLHPDAPAEAELWAFNGAVPGPVLRVRQGEEVRVRLKNRTPSPLSLHWHGVRIANAMDGVGGLTQAPVAPGQDFDYRFTPPDAGTYLFRPCVPGASAEAAERGLSGLLVVEERAAAPVDREHVVVLDDWRLNPDGTLAPFGSPLEAATTGRVGNFLAVAGKPPPHAIEAGPGSRLRLRLANLCNARTTRIRFDDLKAYVIGVDGQPTESFEPLRSTLPFAPGSRFDLLLDLAPEAGAKGTVTALIGAGVPLVTIATAGEAPKRPALPPIVGLPEN